MFIYFFYGKVILKFFENGKLKCEVLVKKWKFLFCVFCLKRILCFKIFEIKIIIVNGSYVLLGNGLCMVEINVVFGEYYIVLNNIENVNILFKNKLKGKELKLIFVIFY